ncbi:MAG TPA: ADOP family duplicated permease [Terriglobales bacterium]|nr:ADOP family duplicated permease [Terriglobales bacterium]
MRLTQVMRNISLALRMMRKRPGAAAIAVLTLAVGVGTTTAMFSVVQQVLLAPLPFRQPQQLLLMHESLVRVPEMNVAWPDYLDWRSQAHSFGEMGAFQPVGTAAYRTASGTIAGLRLTNVSASFFPTLGLGVALGRGLQPGDDRPGAAPVLVISNHFWRTSLRADPLVLGRALEVEGQAAPIVGVLRPTTSDMPWSADAYAALGTEAAVASFVARSNHPGLAVLGRLKSGVTMAQAAADLGLVMQRLAASYPASNQGETAVMQRLDEYLNGAYRSELWMLLGAVGLVLLLACANLAHLLLSQASGRQREFAVRSALGASRRDLLLQSACETLVLAALGGGAGVLLAWGAIPLLVQAPYPVPRLQQAQLNPAVLAFAAVAAMLAALLMGAAPALVAARANLNQRLRALGPQALHSALLLAEAAIAMVIVTGAGLLGRSLARVLAVDPGFPVAHVITLPISHDPAGAPAYFDQVLRKVRALPGVASASAAMQPPLHGTHWTTPYLVGGQPAPPSAERPWAALNMVVPGYFRTLQARLRAGRHFADSDQAHAPLVAIVNETLARKMAAAGQAVGTRVYVQDDNQWRTVVGVIADLRQLSLTAPVEPEIYVPLPQFPVSFVSLVVRSSGDPGPALRGLATAVPTLQPPEMMAAAVGRGLERRDFLTGLMAGFGLLALLLAALGIYAITAQRVAARMRELGVRMALGATPAELARQVLGGTLRLVALGAAAGLVGAYLLGGVWGHLLFGVGSMDPLTLAGGLAVLLGVALGACLRPAWQAMRMDPAAVLRLE